VHFVAIDHGNLAGKKNGVLTSGSEINQISRFTANTFKFEYQRQGLFTIAVDRELLVKNQATKVPPIEGTPRNEFEPIVTSGSKYGVKYIASRTVQELWDHYLSPHGLSHSARPR
jgi:hypothetical protein